MCETYHLPLTCASWMGESAPLSGVFLRCTDGVISGRRRGVFDRLRIGVRGVPGADLLPFPTGVAVERLLAGPFCAKEELKILGFHLYDYSLMLKVV